MKRDTELYVVIDRTARDHDYPLFIATDNDYPISVDDLDKDDEFENSFVNPDVQRYYFIM